MKLRLRFILSKEFDHNAKALDSLTDKIQDMVRIANEIYQKAEIRFEYDIHLVRIQTTGVEDKFYFFNKECPEKYYFPILSTIQLSNQCKELFFREEVRRLQEGTDIKVYYVEEFYNSENGDTDSKGIAIPCRLSKLAPVQNSIFITQRSSAYTLAHEISHILLNAVHDKDLYVFENNIFKTPASAETNHILGEEYLENLSYHPKLHPICKINQIKCMQENAQKLIQGHIHEIKGVTQ